MIINELLEKENMSRYRLSKESGVPMTTITDICSGKGDLDFIIETLETDEIRKLYQRQWYREALYLLAMVDYLSRINGLPICTNYNDIRKQKLEQPLFLRELLCLVQLQVMTMLRKKLSLMQFLNFYDLTL